MECSPSHCFGALANPLALYFGGRAAFDDGLLF